MSSPRDVEADVLTVAIADDHQIFRQSLALLLDAHDDITVVGDAKDGGSVVQLVGATRPDVVILDVDMPGIPVEQAMTGIAEASPATQIVILTMHESPALARRLIQQGASAFLVKSVGHEELVAALRVAARGDSPVVTMSLPRHTVTSASGAAGAVDLSQREKEVLRLVAQAKSNQQIASALHISPGTVKRHLSNMNLKLGASSRLEALRHASALGIIDVHL